VPGAIACAGSEDGRRCRESAVSDKKALRSVRGPSSADAAAGMALSGMWVGDSIVGDGGNPAAFVDMDSGASPSDGASMRGATGKASSTAMLLSRSPFRLTLARSSTRHQRFGTAAVEARRSMACSMSAQRKPSSPWGQRRYLSGSSIPPALACQGQ
jgi:hypothetical protein